MTKNSRLTCAEKAFKERNDQQQVNKQSEFFMEFFKNSAVIYSTDNIPIIKKIRTTLYNKDNIQKIE